MSVLDIFIAIFLALGLGWLLFGDKIKIGGEYSPSNSEKEPKTRSYPAFLDPDTYGPEGHPVRTFVIVAAFVFTLGLAIGPAQGKFIWIVVISLGIAAVISIASAAQLHEKMTKQISELEDKLPNSSDANNKLARTEPTEPPTPDQEEIKSQIKKAILSGRQIAFHYTDEDGNKSFRIIQAITGTWSTLLNTRVLVDGESSTRSFRYDRIDSLVITEEESQATDKVLEKLKDGTLFIKEDGGITRRGGVKRYGSTLDYISKTPQAINKDDAQSLIDSINIPIKEGWLRGVILNIQDGDTFEILLEKDSKSSYKTRLFGVDAPECREDSRDHILGLEAKVFVEDMFAESRYCYVKEKGKETGTFKRYLMDVENSQDRDVAISLLENGLGVPMMGYLKEPSIKTQYENATRDAYDNRLGVWAIDDIHQLYNNIISDTTRTEIDILGYIPEKKSAFTKYLSQNSRANIIRGGIKRKRDNINNKEKGKQIFDFMTSDVPPKTKDLEALKKMCDRYLEEIAKVEELASSKQVVTDCILHIEELVDELELGEGEVKGNFSKGKRKLLYHDNPESRWYQLCIPEIRFKTVEDARYCGFRKASG